MALLKILCIAKASFVKPKNSHLVIFFREQTRGRPVSITVYGHCVKYFRGQKLPSIILKSAHTAYTGPRGEVKMKRNVSHCGLIDQREQVGGLYCM